MLLGATVRKILVDGSQWASWYGYHIPVSESYFVIWTPLGTQMRWRPRTWISSKHQLTYFFPGDWFTLHVGYDSEGRLVSGYGDIVLPCDNYTNTARELSYTDLYIDVVVNEDQSVYTKDQEVFNRAAKRFPIVEESREKAFTVLYWLEEHAKSWTGPFATIPKQLPRTDFETLTIEEASTVFSALS